MAIAVALWSLTITPGEPSVITPPADIRITNVALGDEVTDQSGRTTVKLTYRAPSASADSDEEEEEEDDEKEDADEPSGKVTTAVLCSLTFGKIEQTTVDVVLAEDEEYLFEVVGKNDVHLIGNYIDQQPADQDPYSDDESEDAYDLRDVSSDVEIDPNELDVPSDDEGRFEEVVEGLEEAVEAAKKDKSKKRPRESDAMDTEEQGEKLSKSQKKKQKKLKGADGEAVDAPSPEKNADKADKKKDKKDTKEKDTKEKAETKLLGGGVQVLDSKVGKGPTAKSGDMVSMRYIGKLTTGKIFDQNTKGAPFKFRLGEGEVIKGWDIGIAGMSVGGERRLTIPAPMAYGKKAQADIPANSTLIFEVKLLAIK